MDNIALYILGEPTQIPCIQILDVGRCPDAVELAWVDHQLGDPAEPLERHVELLGVNDRDVPVLFSAQDQRRRCDVLHPVEGLHFLPHLTVLPRQTELELPPALILVVAVVGNVDEGAGAGAGPLETIDETG